MSLKTGKGGIGKMVKPFFQHPYPSFLRRYLNRIKNYGENVVKPGRNQLALAIAFFVFAAAFSVIFWGDVSLAAKIGMFVLGFGSGAAFRAWFSMRRD